jgi:hypothetical protein
MKHALYQVQLLKQCCVRPDLVHATGCIQSSLILCMSSAFKSYGFQENQTEESEHLRIVMLHVHFQDSMFNHQH